MYEASGLLEYARPEYARFLRHHPADAEARLRLANVHYRLGDLDKSIEEYKTVLASSPSDGVVALNLAIAYRDRQRWQEGLAAMAPWTAEGKPLPEGAHKVLGDLALGAGDPPAALSHYHAALAQDRDAPGLSEALAITYEQMDDLAQAQDHWKRILEKDPKHRQAREKLRVLQRKIKAAEKKKR
jgi:tetratricopeptide (TPR) repeat protein